MGEPSATEGHSSPVRVMLADNHAMFRQSIAGMLSKNGEVEVVGDAGSGPEAIEIACPTTNLRVRDGIFSGSFGEREKGETGVFD